MADFLAQSFTDLKARAGADHVLLASLEQAFRDLEGKLRAVKSDFELYRTEATKKEKFLLDRMDQVMQTHAKLFEEKVQALMDIDNRQAKRISEILGRLDDLERPGKDNNNMR